jgi:phosphoglycolate phosphatase
MTEGANSIRLAVFDIDGTLIDSQNSIVEAIDRSWRAFEMEPPSRTKILHIVGLPLLEAIARLAPDQPAERIEALRDRYQTSWADMRREGRLSEPLFPGALEILQTLDDDGWCLGIATGKSRRGVDNLFRSHPLEGRFNTCQTSDVSPGKPNPDMMLNAMAETGAEPPNSAMIGDTTYDIHMARNAGTFAIGVAWGYHSKEDLKAAGAHAVIDDFAALKPTLEGLVDGVKP